MRFADWASLDYHLFWAYDGTVAPSAIGGTFQSRDVSCWLIRKGSVVLKSPGQGPVSVHPGQWVFVASPERHQQFTPDAQLLSVHFQLTWPGHEPVVDLSKNRIFPAADFPALERTARALARVIAPRFPGADAFLPTKPCQRQHYLRIQSLLPPFLNAYLDVQETLGNPLLLRAGQDERLLQMIAQLDRVSFKQTLTTEAIAASLGVSRSQLDALCHAQLGVSARRYIERRRLYAAEQLLTQTGRSIKEVAMELGFRHTSHFCLWFNRLKGTTPTAFREGP